MFTAKPQKNRGAATSYFDEHLSRNDYYSQNETQAGHWIGVGAEKLGLQPGDSVTRQTFLDPCDNLHPGTARQLTQVTGKHRRIFFDFQCAPPKSVSILAVTMTDRRIIQAHRESSIVALRELEQFASTRIRKDGIQDRDRITGNLVGAAFLHTSSRALDPQLHTHFTLFTPHSTPRSNGGRPSKPPACSTRSITAPRSIATNWSTAFTNWVIARARLVLLSKSKEFRPS